MSAAQWAAPSVPRDRSAEGRLVPKDISTEGHLVPRAVSADGHLTGALAVTGVRSHHPRFQRAQ